MCGGAAGEVLTLPFSRSQLVAGVAGGEGAPGVAGGEGAAGPPQQRMALFAAAGTHFTCFTSTKVQLLTQRALLGCAFPRNVAYVSAMAGRYSVYLLYWYRSTNTDAACWQSVG